MLWYVVPLTTVQKKHYKIIYNNQLWFKYQPRTKHTQNNTQQSTVESVAKDCMVHIVTYSVLVGTIAIMLCGWGYIWHTQQFTTFYRIWYIDISWYRASQEYLWWNIWRLYQTSHTAFSMHDISYSSYYAQYKSQIYNNQLWYDYMIICIHIYTSYVIIWCIIESIWTTLTQTRIYLLRST